MISKVFPIIEKIEEALSRNKALSFRIERERYTKEALEKTFSEKKDPFIRITLKAYVRALFSDDLKRIYSIASEVKDGEFSATVVNEAICLEFMFEVPLK